MKTIETLLSEYGQEIDGNGLIKGPGKFEGEPIETLYFWDALLNGDGDEYDSSTYFRLTEEERLVFSFDDSFDGFEIREDTDGFVRGNPCHYPIE